MSSEDDTDGDTRSRANEARSDADADADTDGGGQWQFAVDDVGPDGVTEDTHTPDSQPIEPGSIDLEHAVFVVLGVVFTVGVLVLGF